MKNYLGLDIGASGTKLAVMSLQGKTAVLQSLDRFDASEEGILNEHELYVALRDWLNGKKLSKSSVGLGVQLYQVTSKVSDYPKVDGEALSRMVTLESCHISGFSDQAFVTGYAVMPPGNGRTNPVILALSSESQIDERINALSGAGLKCGGMFPVGIAMAEAYWHLVPASRDCSTPVLLLDIGRDNASAVVVCGGQVLYMGTMMFGASAFEEAARDYLQLHPSERGDNDVADYLQHVRLSDESAHSRLLTAAHMLESEIQGAVEHWRSQECEALAKTPITAVYLSGGGCMLGGLVEWLAEILECDVKPFGPLHDGVVLPEYTVAVGLALLESEAGTLKLSLLPEAVRQHRLRECRWPYLAASAGCLVFGLLGAVLYTLFMDLLPAKHSLEADLETLESATALSQQITAVQKNVAVQELGLYRPVLYGNRCRRFYSLLTMFSKTEMELSDGWLIYIGDDNTAYSSDNFFAGTESFSIRRNADDGEPKFLSLKPDKSNGKGEAFICSGYTIGGQSVQIQSLIRTLNSQDGGFLNGVDRADSISEGNGAELVWKWRDYLKNHSRRLAKALEMEAPGNGIQFADKFELFTLVLPPKEPTLCSERQDELHSLSLSSKKSASTKK